MFVRAVVASSGLREERSDRKARWAPVGHAGGRTSPVAPAKDFNRLAEGTLRVSTFARPALCEDGEGEKSAERGWSGPVQCQGVDRVGRRRGGSI
jgi:hypothetical protein